MTSDKEAWPEDWSLITKHEYTIYHQYVSMNVRFTVKSKYGYKITLNKIVTCSISYM